MNTPWDWLLPPALAFGGVAALTPVVIQLAHRHGWVDEPNADRWHRTPTALMGGIAIVAATALGWLWISPSGPLLWIALAGAILFVAGFVDDRVGLSPLSKMAAQVAGAGVLLAGGLSFTPGWPLWISVPLTLFWVVGITNAVNLLDNMDGVAAGISAIASSGFAVVGWVAGHPEVAVGALVLAAAAGGFLLYNFNPARTFMGDCGSLFLGVSLAGLAMAAPQGEGASSVSLVPWVAISVLVVPILDTSLVTIVRTLVGRSIAQGGRDHATHRLVALGLSERGAVSALYAVGFAFGLVGIGTFLLGGGAGVPLLAIMSLGLVVGGRALAAAQVYDPETEVMGRLRASGQLASDPDFVRWIMRWNHVVLRLAGDAVLLISTFLVAFSFASTAPKPSHLGTALIGLLGTKMTVFALCGLYTLTRVENPAARLVRAVLASVLGSALAIAFLGLVLAPDIGWTVLGLDAALTVVAYVGLQWGLVSFRSVVGDDPSLANAP